MRKINLKTISCGPKGNFNPGIHIVPKEFAADLVLSKHAEYADDLPSEIVTIAPPERAVVRPAETAKAKVAVAPVKPPVTAPAASGNAVASNTVASAKAATWGTGSAK